MHTISMWEATGAIHPFSKSLILFRVMGGWNCSQHTLGERQGTTRTGGQSITHTLTHKGNWEYYFTKPASLCDETHTGTLISTHRSSWSLDLNLTLRRQSWMSDSATICRSEITLWLWLLADGDWMLIIPWWWPNHMTRHVLLPPPQSTVSWQKGSICSVSVTLKSQWDGGRDEGRDTGRRKEWTKERQDS